MHFFTILDFVVLPAQVVRAFLLPEKRRPYALRRHNGAYTRQAEILEQRLRKLKAEDSHKQDDIYSCRVALLKKEI